MAARLHAGYDVRDGARRAHDRQAERVFAAGKSVEVTRVRITDAGRRTLAAESLPELG
jgi:hypothetical protein